MLVYGTVLAHAEMSEGSIPPHSTDETAARVREAAHAVDRAWEVYHRAALGGTVSSPDQQLVIEQHLHEARGLVAQARALSERSDGAELDAVLQKIRHHVDASIAGSRERKK
ncbi:MAG: hypothetical protein U0172_10625 [Nitrospiraceae bacterium]